MRWVGVWTVVAFAAVFAGQPYVAASGMSPQAAAAEGDFILAQAKAAAGGDAWDRLQGWHERGVIQRGDGQVTYETWIDLGGLGIVSTRTMDDSTVVHGADSRTSWVIDPAGGVRLDASPAQLAEGRRNAYFSAFAFFQAQRYPAQRQYVGTQLMGGATYDVVQVTPSGCAPMDLWIDRKTHRIGAIVDPDKANPLIALLADYRPTQGVLLPYTIAESFGGPRAASVQHVAAYQFSPIDPSRFSEPQP